MSARRGCLIVTGKRPSPRAVTISHISGRAELYALFSAHVGRGHEISNVIRGVTIGEFAERLGHPVVWVHAAGLAVFNKRGDHRPVVAALVGAGAADLYSLIVTAKLNDIDPQVRLADVLDRIASIAQNRPHELLSRGWRTRQPALQVAA